MSENVDVIQEFNEQYQAKLSDIKEKYLERLINQVSAELLNLLSNDIIVTSFKLAPSLRLDNGIALSFVKIYPPLDSKDKNKDKIKSILNRTIAIDCPYDVDILGKFLFAFPSLNTDEHYEDSDGMVFPLITDLDELDEM